MNKTVYMLRDTRYPYPVFWGLGVFINKDDAEKCLHKEFDHIYIDMEASASSVVEVIEVAVR